MRAGAPAPLWTDRQVHTIAWSLQPEETQPCSPRAESVHCQEPEVGEGVLCPRGLHFKKGAPCLPRRPCASGVPDPGSEVEIPRPTRNLDFTGEMAPFSGRLQKHPASVRAFPPWSLRFPRQLERP